MQTMDRLESLIVKHPFLSGLDPHFYHFFNECALLRRYEPGQEIFHEHGNAEHFYLIQGGRIALEAHELADGTVPVQELGAGDVLGWSWLFPPFVWHLRARALEPTRAVVLDGAHLLIAAERNGNFGYELMKRVAQVLIHRLQATRKQLLKQQIESVMEG